MFLKEYNILEECHSGLKDTALKLLMLKWSVIQHYSMIKTRFFYTCDTLFSLLGFFFLHLNHLRLSSLSGCVKLIQIYMKWRKYMSCRSCVWEAWHLCQLFRAFSLKYSVKMLVLVWNWTVSTCSVEEGSKNSRAGIFNCWPMGQNWPTNQLGPVHLPI